MTDPGLKVLEVSEEEQVTDGDERVRVRKERLDLGGGIVLLRKFSIAGPTRPRVMLVHGFAQNRYTWHGSRRSMSAWLAARGWDVVLLDLRGHGASAQGARPDRFEDYVADAERISDTLGEPGFWIGHSLGGAISYALATRRKVRGVVGLGGLFRFAQANRVIHWLCRLSALAPAGALGRVSVRTRLVGKVLGRLYGISDVAGYAFPISGWAPDSIEPDLLAERLERGFDWTSLQVWLDMARWGAGGEVGYESAWRATDVPVMVVAGDLDHLMPPEDARTAYDASGSTDRTLSILDPWTTGRHWGHLDLIVGKDARRWVWEPVHDWMAAR